jgi:hypothetical protein
MARFKRILELSVVLSASFALTACSEYLDRKETVLFGAGEAVATNQLAHTIDPWSAHAANTRILASGERLGAAVRRYQDPPKSSGSPSTVINVR